MGEKVWIEAERDDDGSIRFTNGGDLGGRWSAEATRNVSIVPASELQRVPRRLPQTEEEWRECIGKRVQAGTTWAALRGIHVDRSGVLLWVPEARKSMYQNNPTQWPASWVTEVEGWSPPEPEEEIVGWVYKWPSPVGPRWSNIYEFRDDLYANTMGNGQLCKVVVVDDPQETGGEK